MPGVTVVEGKVPGKGQRTGPKVLAHIEIHPKMGGGHMVKHVYSGYQHEPKEYSFKKDEGERAMAHIARHAGLPMGEGSGEGEEEGPEAEEEGMGKPKGKSKSEEEEEG